MVHSVKTFNNNYPIYDMILFLATTEKLYIFISTRGYLISFIPPPHQRGHDCCHPNIIASLLEITMPPLVYTFINIMEGGEW